MYRADVEEIADDMHPGHSTETSEPGIALALGGGVAPGWAHIGVIRALDEAAIPIKMIAGTSIGALVGGCYLAGKLDELEKFARSLTPRRIVGFLDISLRGAGLISGYKLAERMEEHMGNVRIENLSRPMVCVSTEISTGHEIWLSEGSLIDAMRASYALPGIFEPVRIGNRILVDGALVNPVPVSVCRAFEADAVVAVNLSYDVFGRGTVVRNLNHDFGDVVTFPGSSQPKNKNTMSRLGKALGITGAMVEAFNIIQDRIARSRLAGDPPDISLRPPVGSIGLAEFHRADEAIDIGYEATKLEIPRLRALSSARTTAIG